MLGKNLDQIFRESTGGYDPIAWASVPGGSVCRSFVVDLHNKTKLFIKVAPCKEKMFLAEKKGLDELRRVHQIRVPEVFHVTPHSIVMEYIESAPPKAESPLWLAEGIAEMHSKKSFYFGYSENNYIGSLLQENTQVSSENSDNWVQFYLDYRLAPQLERLPRNTVYLSELKTFFKKLYQQILDFFPQEDKITPTLLHGDLWSGNLFFDTDGQPCFFDPAVYYGDPEVDLAMMKLFGGVDEAVYEYYTQIKPPRDGYSYRIKLYHLYYLLVHLNLFGDSYYPSLKKILEDLTEI